LQWWRDALVRAEAGETTGHPVADAFGGVLTRRKLSRERIAGLIDARSYDIEEAVMPDSRTLSAYLADTTGGLFALAAEISGAEGENQGLVAQAAGQSYGLVRVMRSLPVLAAKGRTYLAADALARANTAPEDLFAGRTTPGLRSLLGEMRDSARAALQDARFHLFGEGMKGTGLNDAGKSAYLPLALVEPYLAALEKVKDPLRNVARINPLYRLWRLMRAR
ncbi:MAG: squalene/phytoene synthase family protein, partial [Pseudomonadota bacterium]